MITATYWPPTCAGISDLRCGPHIQTLPCGHVVATALRFWPPVRRYDTRCPRCGATC